MIFMLTLLALSIVLILFLAVKFVVDVYRKKWQMQKYNCFVKAQYGDPRHVPGLILRIQNEYIDEYNRLAESTMGRFCKIKVYKRDRSD